MHAVLVLSLIYTGTHHLALQCSSGYGGTRCTGERTKWFERLQETQQSSSEVLKRRAKAVPLGFVRLCTLVTVTV
ncbi:hypothetical protein K438DRAFT_199344 [Mycena galopus ATCC 62051]|nr:hypothetical protein K438DRAFT_199344 [Mycena galopus ATCC 62051]